MFNLIKLNEKKSWVELRWADDDDDDDYSIMILLFYNL